MEMEKKKVPLPVWIITIFYFIGFVSSLFSFSVIYVLWDSLPPESRIYFESMTIFDWTFSFAVLIANLIGVVLLLRLRKLAFNFLAAALAMNLITLIWHSLSKNWVQAVGVAGIAGVIGPMIGYVIAVGVCVYVYKLIKNGTLT